MLEVSSRYQQKKIIGSGCVWLAIKVALSKLGHLILMTVSYCRRFSRAGELTTAYPSKSFFAHRGDDNFRTRLASRVGSRPSAIELHH